MSLAKTNFILSNVNALLGSTAGALDDKKKGVDAGTTAVNFGLNVANGAVRNQIAYDMRKTTGSNMGFLINNMAGYGNDKANAKGMMGLMGASIMTSMLRPWGFGGGCCGGGFGGFGGGYYGGGFCGGSVFGGGYMGGMRPGGFYSYMNPNFFPTADAKFFFGTGRPHGFC